MSELSEQDFLLLLEKAKRLAVKHHGGCFRKSGAEYITHLWNVLAMLQSYNLPVELQIAGVLHDIIEDSEITQEDLKNEFGDRVAFIVSAVSKMQKPPLPDEFVDPMPYGTALNKEFYEKLTVIESQNFRFLTYISKFYYCVVIDPWVAFVKIADQIDNLRDVEVFPLKKAERKLFEIHFYFYPIYERITETNVMSPTGDERYERMKLELLEMLERKKKELGIDFGPIPKKKRE